MNFADRIKDTISSNGTGPFTLSGLAPSGYQAIGAIGAVGASFPYAASTGGLWETGVATITAANVVSRAPTASSAGGSLVDFPAGAEFICTMTAAQVVAILQATGGPLAVQVVATTGPTLTLPFVSGMLESSYAVTVRQNVAITIGDAPAGFEQRMVVELIQDGTGGRVVTFTNPSWAGGIPPTFDASANRHNTVTFRGVGADVTGAPYMVNRVQNTSAAPTAPDSLTVTPGDTQNTLTAAAVSAYPPVSGYTFYRGTSAGGESATPIATNVPNGYVDTGRTNGVKYYYTASAVNTVGTGPRSPESSGTPTTSALHYAIFDGLDDAIFTPPSPTFVPGSSSFDMRARVRMSTYNVQTNLFGCWDVNASKRSWRLGIDATGHIRADWATSATTFPFAVSSVPISAPANADISLRAAVNPVSGSVTFYTSVDGTTWTQLGATVTASSPGAVYTATALPYLVVGQNASASSSTGDEFYGRFIEAQFSVAGVVITNPVMGPSSTIDSKGFNYSGSSTISYA